MNFVKTTLSLLVAISIAVVGHAVYQARVQKRAIGDATRLVEKGYFAMAEKKVTPFLDAIAGSQEGCKLLQDIYSKTNNLDSLDWVSEACLEAGIESSEAYVQVSSLLERRGKTDEAIKALKTAQEKYDQDAKLVLGLAKLYLRIGKSQELAQLYLDGAEKFSTDQSFLIEALNYFLNILKNDKSAFQVANHLRKTKLEKLELKLYVARALKNGGDIEGSKGLVLEARPQFEKDPYLKQQVEKVFADIL